MTFIRRLQRLTNLLMVGFSSTESIELEGFVTIIHSPFVGGNLSAREYELNCKKVITHTDIIIINLSKKNYSLDESFLLFSAYTNNTPIIGVGFTDNFFIDSFLSNRFEFMEDAAPHIRENY